MRFVSSYTLLLVSALLQQQRATGMPSLSIRKCLRVFCTGLKCQLLPFHPLSLPSSGSFNTSTSYLNVGHLQYPPFLSFLLIMINSGSSCFSDCPVVVFVVCWQWSAEAQQKLPSPPALERVSTVLCGKAERMRVCL